MAVLHAIFFLRKFSVSIRFVMRQSFHCQEFQCGLLHAYTTQNIKTSDL